jgi:hypothetical protein
VSCAGKLDVLASHSTVKDKETYDRALVAMMNGQLRAKATTSINWVMEEPDWILSPATDWTAEQKALASQFIAEKRRLDQEREARRQILESEVCDKQSILQLLQEYFETLPHLQIRLGTLNKRN